MTLKTAKEIHGAINAIRDNTHPAEIAGKMLEEGIDPGIVSLGTLLAGMQTIMLIQARALALILERVEEGDFRG